MRDKR